VQAACEAAREYRSIPWRVAYFFMAKTTPGSSGRHRESAAALPCVCLRRNDTDGGWDAGERDAGPKSISVMAHQCPRTYKNNQAGSRMRATMAQKAIPIYFTAQN